MKKNLLVAIVVFALVALCAQLAIAHDGDITTSFSDVGIGAQQGIDHPDADPWAGWFYVIVENTSNVAWGDFHFYVSSLNGSDVSNVDFTDLAVYKTDPLGTPVNMPVTANVSPDKSFIDLYYYANPVNPGDTVLFGVANVNPDHVDFRVCFYPTVVPEPGSLLALGSGLVGLVGFVIRKRK